MSESAEPLALCVRGLSKSFNGRTVLSSMDLDIAASEIHALVGENGSGKSTLIKVLAGYHEPDDGASVLISGSALSFGSARDGYGLGCRFVHQDLGLLEDLSILDNVLLNTGFPTRLGTIRTNEARRTVAVDLERVGLSMSPDTLIKALSPAEKTGVAVAKALRPDPNSTARFLVLDEPTATLPAGEVDRLLTMVKSVAARGIGVLYVTHRLSEIFEIADYVTVLRNGVKVATEPTSEITRAELINLMVGREFEEISERAAAGTVEPGAVALTVEHLSAGPIRDLSLTVRSGELVGIAGITGSGAESLLSTVFGGLPRERGVVRVDDQEIRSHQPDRAVAAGLAYMPPDRKVSGGIMDHSARENLTLSSMRSFSSFFRIRGKKESAEVARWFEDLSVRPATGAESLLATFSGGNQQKVLFAKWLRLKPAVFLLDEPTQGVDVGAKALLHRQLIDAAERGMAVVVSSTDVDELAVLCQRVIVLREGVIGADLRGSDVTVRNISSTSLGTTHESAA